MKISTPFSLVIAFLTASARELFLISQLYEIYLGVLEWDEKVIWYDSHFLVPSIFLADTPYIKY